MLSKEKILANYDAVLLERRKECPELYPTDEAFEEISKICRDQLAARIDQDEYYMSHGISPFDLAAQIAHDKSVVVKKGYIHDLYPPFNPYSPPTWSTPNEP